MIDKKYTVRLVIDTVISAESQEELEEKVQDLKLKYFNDTLPIDIELVVADVIGEEYYEDEAIKYDRGDYDYSEE